MKKWLLYSVIFLSACQNSSDNAQENKLKKAAIPEDPQVAVFEQTLAKHPDSTDLRAQFVQYLDSTAQYNKALEQSKILLSTDS
ncbi:MAG TPA: hypothetical protein DIW54_00810, partial [Chitinophagaceae bacterium]|nr:hypothetical protein [Chitinophagaceae bacterium]